MTMSEYSRDDVPSIFFDSMYSSLEICEFFRGSRSGVDDESITTLLVGPGMASDRLPDDLKTTADSMWHESSVPMVVDASAHDWLTAGAVPEKSIRVIPPHPGEAARLLGTTPAEVQADRVEALQALSAKFGNCHVVLKGRHTLIGQTDGTVYVNATGNPALGQGGSGDLLAGYLAGLLAQPLLQDNAGLAIRLAVWQHGAAADALSASSSNWTIEDLANWIGGKQP